MLFWLLCCLMQLHLLFDNFLQYSEIAEFYCAINCLPVRYQSVYCVSSGFLDVRIAVGFVPYLFQLEHRSIFMQLGGPTEHLIELVSNKVVRKTLVIWWFNPQNMWKIGMFALFRQPFFTGLYGSVTTSVPS